jgi:hypothetical protein
MGKGNTLLGNIPPYLLKIAFASRSHHHNADTPQGGISTLRQIDFLQKKQESNL